ncbi:MAG: tripartite tricarboxylate transporter substrate binding protein [Burkholderiales bacterium]|nr:tripartite tricarboxylate transporter substrate binding protein [Burkholderiales bacterium]
MTLEPLASAFAVAATLAVTPALAQAPAAGKPTYPVRAVRLVVGFAPGGGTDILARLIAQKLTPVLGEQIVVDNRPGANGNLAAEMVAKTPADGHTLLIMSVQYTIGKALYRNLGYDLEKDFVGVADVALVPQVVVVHPSLPVKSVNELIAFARSRPGQITYASSGNGSVEQMAGEMLKNAAKIDLLHVPYKGGGPAAIDLVAGHVYVGFNTIPPVMQFIKHGRVRILAVTSATRVNVLPEVPTVAEAAIPGYAMSTWYGILAPSGTPPAVVGLLNSEIAKAVAATDITEKFTALGAGPLGRMKPEQFSAFIRDEVAKYAKVARENSLKVD